HRSALAVSSLSPPQCHTPLSTLFPYTTLFRSDVQTDRRESAARLERPARARCRGLQAREDRRLRGLYRRQDPPVRGAGRAGRRVDRKSTRLNSSHQIISYAVFCLKKKNQYKLT